MKRAGLVLEGGANRGVFTSGALDYLMEQDFYIPYVVGTSAGACNAVDYVSRQPLRTKNCTIITDKKKRYVTIKNTLKTGTLLDMDLIFEKYPNEIFPFDFDTFFQSDTECEMVVTNCHTGDAEYMSEKHDRRRLMDIGRASSSIPVVSPMVEIDGVPYLDGGIADSIPLIHAMEKGYRKNVVILTRNMGYRKKKPGKSTPLYVAAFRHYPEFLNTLYNRYHSYNRTLELLEKWEREGHIFVIRPEMPTVGRAEANKEKLMAFYQHGYDVMKDHYEELQAYLSR
mgnify:CR=1 FL=1